MNTPAAGDAPIAPISGGGTRRIARPGIWPSQGYARQVERLRRMIGHPVYIVELTFNGLAVGAVFSGEPHMLLDIVDSPRPTPSNGLYPHMLVIDDGRGINLGRIARVTVNRPFDPRRSDVLYEDRALARGFLYRKSRFTHQRIAFIARRQLRALLGAPLDERERLPRRKTGHHG